MKEEYVIISLYDFRRIVKSLPKVVVCTKFVLLCLFSDTLDEGNFQFILQLVPAIDYNHIVSGKLITEKIGAKSKGNGIWFEVKRSSR